MTAIDLWRTADRRCVLVLSADKHDYILRLLEGERIVRDEPMESVDDVIATARRWQEQEKGESAPSH
jgi:hypothetical protein